MDIARVELALKRANEENKEKLEKMQAKLDSLLPATVTAQSAEVQETPSST